MDRKQYEHFLQEVAGEVNKWVADPAKNALFRDQVERALSMSREHDQKLEQYKRNADADSQL